MVKRPILSVPCAILLLQGGLLGCKPSGFSPAPATPAPAPSIAPASAAEQSGNKGLPDPALTPGERTPQPNKRADIKPDIARKVLEAYKIKPGDPRSEICRLIPPELGGTDNTPNLFVTTPWFAGLKARLDSKLVQMVNAKQVTADQAVTELKANWIKASHKYYVRNYGEGDSESAKKKEDALNW